MYIVLEGTDNSGKSTLADQLSLSLNGIRVQRSEGPEKYPGEINERVRRYLDMPAPLLFDRHPCVSNQIYRQIKDGYTSVDQELLDRFYASKPFFIFCRVPPERGLGGHELKDHDTPEHMAAVETHLGKLVELYDAWGVQYARVIYRIGDALNPILAHIREYNHVTTYQSRL